MTPGRLSGLRVTQADASGPEVEAASTADPRDRLEELLAADPVTEAFVLQTCLRAEQYVVTDDPDAGRRLLSTFAPDVSPGAVVRSGHEASLRHLIRVAAGLESFVAGEGPVLGQFRDAFGRAEEAGAVGPVLEPALLKAIHVGERARTETAINEGPTSIGGAAAALLEREHSLPDSTALVVGAGEMGTHAAESLDLRGTGRLVLANRSRWRAERLATGLDRPVEVVDLGDIGDALAAADVVVTATASPSPVVSRDALAAAGPTVVVDVARPRDVARSAADLEGVTVHDLDAIASLTESARDRRREATERVESMVEAATAELVEEYRRNRIDGVVAGMYRGAERTKRRELDTALSKLEHHGGLTDEQREDVEALADAIVSKLLAPPTEALREAAAAEDWGTVEAAVDLVDPELDDEGDVPAPLAGEVDDASRAEGERRESTGGSPSTGWRAGASGTSRATDGGDDD